MTDNGAVRPPVLGDVARLAGVSVPTVSRVLTGSKPVGDELRERVLNAVRELEYHPNNAARALVSGRRSMISVLSGGTANYGYARTLEGLESAAREAGMTVAITVVESDDEDIVAATLALALGQPIAGVVVLEFDRPGLAAARALPMHVPAVMAGGGAAREGDRPYALIDEAAGARALTEHLLGLGHRTVHHVAGPSEGKVSPRTEGWRDTLRAHGKDVPETLHADWHPRSGYEAGALLASRTDVTAVLCGNDDIAIGVISALDDHGLRVPEDVSVVGFDDQPYADFWKPSLTTARQDFDDLGARAFAQLQRLMSGEAAAGSVVAPELVVRGSSGPAPAVSRPS